MDIEVYCDGHKIMRVHIPTDSNEKKFVFEFETAHPTLDNKGFVVHTIPLYFY